MYGTVTAARRLTPSMVRIELSCAEELTMPDATDAYINIALPPVGADYQAPFDPDQIRTDRDKATWPARRRYTVRSYHADQRTLVVDFVVHEPAGIAATWAANASPGDLLVFTGPSGGYSPDRSADWHLMVGDESAVPAIAAALEALSPEDTAVVRLLCDGPDHEIELTSPARLDLAWSHRRGEPGDAMLLAEMVRDLAFPEGRASAFVHGEADEIRAIRKHLLAERHMTRQDMSCSPYWRREMTDEAWRTVKRDFVAAMEEDV